MASSQIVLVVRSQRIILGVNETNIASMRSIFAGNLERASSSLLQSNTPSVERISNSIMRMVESSQLQPPNNSLDIANGSQQQLLTYVASQHTVSWRNAGSPLVINEAETSELQLQYSSNQDNIRVSLRESFSDGDNITFLFILYLFFHCDETNHDSMLYDENDESNIQHLPDHTSEEVPEEMKAVSDELITSSQSHLITDDAIEASSEVIKKTDDIQVLSRGTTINKRELPNDYDILMVCMVSWFFPMVFALCCALDSYLGPYPVQSTISSKVYTFVTSFMGKQTPEMNIWNDLYKLWGYFAVFFFAAYLTPIRKSESRHHEAVLVKKASREQKLRNIIIALTNVALASILFCFYRAGCINSIPLFAPPPPPPPSLLESFGHYVLIAFVTSFIIYLCVKSIMVHVGMSAKKEASSYMKNVHESEQKLADKNHERIYWTKALKYLTFAAVLVLLAVLYYKYNTIFDILGFNTPPPPPEPTMLQNILWAFINVFTGIVLVPGSIAIVCLCILIVSNP